MNNIFVYCELTEEGTIADVSLELCSKARKLADELHCKVETVVLGKHLQNIENQLSIYGVDVVNIADDERLSPYSTLPHFAVVNGLISETCPEIMLFGATSVGRDLAPRLASRLKCGLTADCTNLEIGDHADTKTGKSYKNLLYQIRPAFGGNIIATIVNHETRPQMATVREGVMKKELVEKKKQVLIKKIDVSKYLNYSDLCVEIIERAIEPKNIDIKNSSVIVAGGYGVGSKENFELLHQLAELLGGEVGATRAAVDAGFCEPERQIGQTGVTVRPKLYIACGISGAVQHRAGMDQSSTIISINTDQNAPISQIADYKIVGDLKSVLPKIIKAYKENKR